MVRGLWHALPLCACLLACDAAAQSMSRHTAQLNGDSVFYREAGDPGLPTIVLLHGFPSSSHMFRELMPALAGQFHVLAPDYPGMGYSMAPPEQRGAVTFDSLADIIERFVASASQGKVILYMQDFGGPVGMRLATRHPEWLRSTKGTRSPPTVRGIAAHCVECFAASRRLGILVAVQTVSYRKHIIFDS